MNKPKRWPKILAAIIVLIAVFVYTAPASLIENQVQEANLPIQLTGYQGRLLNGNVLAVFVDGVTFENLGWRLNPIAFLSQELSAILSIEDKEAKLSIDLRFKDQTEWQFSDLNGHIVLSKITPLSPILTMVKPGGDIVFQDIKSALQANTFSDTQGRLNWRDASVNINGQNLLLGLIEGKLTDDGDYLYLNFNGLEGIQPTGQVKVSPTGEFELDFTLNPDYLPANMNWLNSMAQRNTSGRLVFGLKGQL